MSKTLQSIIKGIKFFFIVPSAVSFLYLSGYQIWLKTSDAYALAQKHAKSDLQIRKATGGVKGFGFFVSGLIDDLKNNEANLTFTVRGNYKNVLVDAHLRWQNEQWKLVRLKTHSN